MDHSNDTLAAMPFIIGIVFWIVCAVVALIVAPDDRQVTFALLTLFILGPIGVAAAAIAQSRELPEPEPELERRALADGRRRFNCPRCGADNDSGGHQLRLLAMLGAQKRQTPGHGD